MYAKEENKQRNCSNKISVEFVEGEAVLPGFTKQTESRTLVPQRPHVLLTQSRLYDRKRPSLGQEEVLVQIDQPIGCDSPVGLCSGLPNDGIVKRNSNASDGNSVVLASKHNRLKN
jgi:hypothetical protein